MCGLFATQETVAELSDSTTEKTLLIGGFMGHWNFGDVLQLKSAIACHRNTKLSVVPVPLVNLKTVHSPADVEKLESIFSTSHTVFYAPSNSLEEQARAQQLQFVPLRPPPAGRVSLHLYGGGILNQYWGAGYIELVEFVLSTCVSGQYLISGQQIDSEFADTVAIHCRAYQPDVIGCRDDASVAMLRRRGIRASFSGDDAVDEIAPLAQPQPLNRHDSGSWNGHLGLHLNLSSYALTDRPEDNERSADSAAIGRVALELEPLRDLFTDDEPLILGALAERTLSFPDSLVSLAMIGLTDWFPRLEFIDLVGSVANDRLRRDCAALGACSLVVSSSYHTALLGKFLNVPTYLLAFNAYYRQKRQTLAEPHQSLADFLAQGPAAARDRQCDYVEQLRLRRQAWRQMFARARERPTPRRRQIAGGQSVGLPWPNTKTHERASAKPDAQDILREREARIRELVGWIGQIEAGKAWLEDQRAAWQKTAEEQCHLIAELRATIAQLQTAQPS